MSHIKAQIDAIARSIDRESPVLSKHESLGVICQIGLIIVEGRGSGRKCSICDAFLNHEILVQACWSIYKTFNPPKTWRTTQPQYLKMLVDELDATRPEELFKGFEKFRRRFD